MSLLPFIHDIAWWPDPELKQQVVNLQEKNDSLKVKNNKLEQLVETLKISPDQENYASQIAQLKERVDLLTIENDALKSRSPDNTANESLIGQLNDKDNQLKNCKMNLQNVQNSLATSNSRLEELNKSVDYYRGLFENCNNSTADLKRRMEVLVSELNSTRSQLNKCNEDLARASKGGDGREIKALYAQLRSCQGALSVCNGNLKNVRDSLKRCQTSTFKPIPGKIIPIKPQEGID